MWEGDSACEHPDQSLTLHVCLGGTVARELEVELVVVAHRHQMCGEIQEEISIPILGPWVSWQWRRVGCRAEEDKNTGRKG